MPADVTEDVANTAGYIYVALTLVQVVVVVTLETTQFVCRGDLTSHHADLSCGQAGQREQQGQTDEDRVGFHAFFKLITALPHLISNKLFRNFKEL